MSDIDIDLNLDERGNIIVHEGIAAIRNQLQVIFNTILGEIPKTPDTGSFLWHSLFNPITEVTEAEIEASLRQAVESDGTLTVVSLGVQELNKTQKSLNIYMSVQDATGDIFDFTDSGLALSYAESEI